MKSIPIVYFGREVSACSVCGNVYEKRMQAVYCYNTHGGEHAVEEPVKKPPKPIGKVDPKDLDQKLVNRWT